MNAHVLVSWTVVAWGFAARLLSDVAKQTLEDAMPPSPPAIIGPVSNCSRAVRVMGQTPSARVRIYIENDPVPIGDAPVDWADTFVAIDQSRLVADRTIRATQEIGGQESPRSPAGEVVEKAINGNVHLPDPIYECAQAIHLSGCSPGADLRVSQGGVLLGAGTAAGDEATITFLPLKRVKPGPGVEVTQRICTDSFRHPTMSSLPVDPPTQNQSLHTPVIVEPLLECTTQVEVTELVPGATLRLFRDGDPVFDAPIAHETVRVRLPRLKLGQKYEALQELPLCVLRCANPGRATVKKLESLKPPRIDGPLCATPHKVTLSRLMPGATVILLANDAEIGRWEAGASSMPVDVEIPTGATLNARQELCGVISPTSRDYGATSLRRGRWFRVEDENGANLLARSFAIHTALVPPGKIVIFSGDQHNRAQLVANPQDINHCELFDCGTFTLEKIGAPRSDVFCSAHAFAPDGRLLVAGGTEKWREDAAVPHGAHFSGLSQSWTFNPLTKDGRYWRQTENMLGGGRWYPMLLTRPNGDILALSGHPEEADTVRHHNNTMESWRSGDWERHGETSAIDTSFEAPSYLYPRLFSGPRGEVFSATPIAAEDGVPPHVPRRSASWSGTGLDWTRNGLPPSGGWGAYDDFYTPATLLPLLEEDRFRFQVLRAGNAGTDSGWVIDLGTPTNPVDAPTWQRLGNRSAQADGRARFNSNLVLLPSGEVFLCGGVTDTEDDDSAVKAPELLVRTPDGWKWDPSPFREARFARNYHSTALLMPDGRVFTGGGNINSQSGGEDRRRLELEIYEPWYVCRQRPRILNAPKSISPGSNLRVDVRGPGPITRLALVRCGSATHSFNSDQRYIGLKAEPDGPGSYRATIPDRAVAIPGYYVLFACRQDADGLVPSQGNFLRIDPT
ncbi:glyoxal oxidase [Streptomyces phaeochromogenes]|uniref:glyoxal oxidase n=1 Tax=Streptomyces phaeochromogenes TaxID=1923 RepID=UPI003718B0B1